MNKMQWIQCYEYNAIQCSLINVLNEKKSMQRIQSNEMNVI